MNIEKTLHTAQGREFAFDLSLPETNPPANGHPILVFAHGFKGFKDWGHWYRLATEFTQSGYAFLKFDYSHNGTRPGDRGDFTDLEAFAENNFSKELADIQSILNWISENAAEFRLNPEKIALIGHSRSGPIVLLTAASDDRVRAVMTWASVSSLDYAMKNPAEIQAWKEKGVIYMKNARTGQEMPLHYQLAEDFFQNQEAFSLPSSMKDFSKPVLLVHGSADVPVPPEAAHELKCIIPQAELVIIPGGDHVFGGHHPFGAEEALPAQAQQLLTCCLDFLSRNL